MAEPKSIGTLLKDVVSKHKKMGDIIVKADKALKRTKNEPQIKPTRQK